jgi:hypothetical protein
MSDLTLRELDRDGAIAEALERLHGTTRAQLLRRAVLGSAALLAAVATPSALAQDGDSDADILNYALTLEYVQDSFYGETERIGALTGSLATQARVVADHERAHVEALRKTLGAKAVKRPRFDFRGATEDADKFRRTAVAFEDLAVAAYKDQAPLINRQAYLASALAIHSVEARHAAWIRRLAGIQPAADAFDEPRSKSSTLAIVERTHFTVSMESAQRPRFIG